MEPVDVKLGVVVDSVWDRTGGKPGGDFVLCKKEIYKLPDEWYERKRNPPPAFLATMSKSQRNKLGERFHFGDNVKFRVARPGSTVIEQLGKGSVVYNYYNPGTGFVMDCLCVVSNEVQRRCYVKNLDLVPISAELAESVLPNVPFLGRIALEIDTNFAEEGITFENCHASVRMHIDSFVEVDHSRSNLAWKAPWNEGRRQQNRDEDARDMLADGIEDYELRREDDRLHEGTINNAHALMLSGNEMYCVEADGLPVRVALTRSLPAVGQVMVISAYWCSLNEAFVVWRMVPPTQEFDVNNLETRTQPGPTRDVVLFKTSAIPTGIGGHFECPIIGNVYDKDNILHGLRIEKDRGVDVWVRHWARNTVAHFVVVDAETTDIDPLDEYEGYGLVVNVLGEVFIKELALERCRLTDEFLGQFLVGEWVFLRARRSRDGQNYEVFFARHFPNDMERFAARRTAPNDVERFPALRTALTPDGKIALKVRNVTKWMKNNFVFHEKLIGLMHADTSVFADFIRFSHQATHEATVDLWVVESDNPLAQVRFKAISVVRPGPIVEVIASGNRLPADTYARISQQQEVPPAAGIDVAAPHAGRQQQPAARRNPAQPIEPANVHGTYTNWLDRLRRRHVREQQVSPGTVTETGRHLADLGLQEART